MKATFYGGPRNGQTFEMKLEERSYVVEGGSLVYLADGWEYRCDGYTRAEGLFGNVAEHARFIAHLPTIFVEAPAQ